MSPRRVIMEDLNPEGRRLKRRVTVHCHNCDDPIPSHEIIWLTSRAQPATEHTGIPHCEPCMIRINNAKESVAHDRESMTEKDLEAARKNDVTDRRF